MHVLNMVLCTELPEKSPLETISINHINEPEDKVREPARTEDTDKSRGGISAIVSSSYFNEKILFRSNTVCEMMINVIYRICVHRHELNWSFVTAQV